MTAFWDWALRAYGGEGVAEACLALQDDHGQSVPLILWGVWSHVTGCVPDTEMIEASVDTARAWSETTIAPLRAIRRRLKSPIGDMDATAREAIRARIKADELEAERLLMAALCALTNDTRPSGENGESLDPKQVMASLVALSKAWNGVVARITLNSLLEALTKGNFLRYNP